MNGRERLLGAVPAPRRSARLRRPEPASGGWEADSEARALLWRCRRGMKELDILLERYARSVLPQVDAGERRLLARLLDHPDPELAGYFLGGVVPPEPEMAALVTRITQKTR